LDTLGGCLHGWDAPDMGEGFANVGGFGELDLGWVVLFRSDGYPGVRSVVDPGRDENTAPQGPVSVPEAAEVLGGRGREFEKDVLLGLGKDGSDPAMPPPADPLGTSRTVGRLARDGSMLVIVGRAADEIGRGDRPGQRCGGRGAYDSECWSGI